jgi:hypothetical protein
MSDPAPASLAHPDPLPRGAEGLRQIVFFPVLVLQVLWVKWRTPRMQEPKGAREGVLGQGRDPPSRAARMWQ